VNPKGVAAGAAAFVTCPCHLALTYPLLAAGAAAAGISLTFSSAMTGLTVLFVISLAVLSIVLRRGSGEVVENCCEPDGTGLSE